MTKLITVHGTGSGLDADIGALWWQEDSAFIEQMNTLLDLQRVEIIPFHWGEGPNSEQSRRQAGHDLYEMLDGLDEAGEDYALIGHSHGGMVIYNALQVSASKRDPLKRLVAWCTIGSPFLDVRPRALLVQRLDPPGLAVLMLIAAQAFVVLTLVVGHLAGSNLTSAIDLSIGVDAFRRFYLPLLLASAMLAAIGYALLYLYEWWRHQWIATSVKRRVVNLYAHNWIGLFHDDDEALAALRATSTFKPRVVPRTVLSQFFATLPVAAFAVALAAIVYWLETELADPTRQSALKTWFQSALPENLLRSGWFPGLTVQIQWSLLLGFVLVFATAVVYVFRAIGRMLGLPFSAIVDRLVWRSIREQVYGDDMYAEYVHSISSHPPMFPVKFAPLADPVASDISAISGASAIATLKKLRSQFGLFGFGEQTVDPVGSAMSQLSWHELIHTTYFDSLPFARMVSLALHRHGLAGLRRPAWTDEQKTETRAALAAVNAPSRLNNDDRATVDGGSLALAGYGSNLSVAQKTLISLFAILATFAVGVAGTAFFVSIEAALVIWGGGGGLLLLLAELQPVSTRGLIAHPTPTRTFDEAVARFKRWTGRPEGIIHPRCEAYVMHHGKRTQYSCILIHGISNCPYSMVDFAPRLHDLGCNVLVARMPFNGHIDNTTDALRHVTAENLRAFADECVDIGLGLSNRVLVLGISAGGVVTGWIAQNRRDVDHAILIAPAFGLSSFGVGLNTSLMRLMLGLPNFSVWKDPIRRASAESRPHSYKRQATHGMGEVMRLGLATAQQAAAARAAAARITVVTNEADQAVDPAMTQRLVRRWRSKNSLVYEFSFQREYELPHEIIDPTEDNSRSDIVYPILLEIIQRWMVPRQEHDTATSHTKAKAGH
jgi:alpha-beta hydrolase superfamily lysophospholipase